MENEIESSNTPIGGEGNEPALEVRGTDGVRRPMSPTEARVLRERQGRVMMNASDQQALDKIIEQDDAAKAKEEAARRAGDENWKKLEEQTDSDEDSADETQYPSRQKVGDTGIEVPGETPREHLEMVEANLREVAAIGKEIGLATETLQTLVDDVVETAVMDLSGVSVENPQAVISVMSRRYGVDEVNKIVSDARDAVDMMGEKVRTYLRKSGLGNDPNVLLALARWKRGDYRMAPDAANAELKKIQSNKAYAAETPEGRLLRDRARLLYKLADRKPAKKSEPAKPKAKAASETRNAQLDAKIKALNNHPAVRDKSHPEYGTVRAQLDAAYNERWPGSE